MDDDTPKRLCVSCDGRILKDQAFTEIGTRGHRTQYKHNNYEDCQAALSFGSWHSHLRHGATSGMVAC